MHIRNEPTCWSTPISFARSVVLASLVDEGALSITFKAQTDTGVALVCFEFRDPISYQIERRQSWRTMSYAVLGATLIRTVAEHVSSCDLINTDVIGKYMLASEEHSSTRFIFRARDCDVIVDSLTTPSIRTIATQRQKIA
jgi:hypothetical protein